MIEVAAVAVQLLPVAPFVAAALMVIVELPYRALCFLFGVEP